MANNTPKKKPLTKTEFINQIADDSGLPRKDVAAMLVSLGNVVRKEIGKKGAGVISLPGLIKIQRLDKPATKARTGINPFTKEETTFKAKPARSVIKVRPLKGLKEMV